MTPFPFQPSAAVLSETVDTRAGLIRARGRLTAQGADLLRGTATQLRASGHTRVVLDLGGVSEVDGAGLAILDRLYSSFSADGGQLLITHPPSRP